jgi:DNA-binding NtrC family response regulator
MSVVTSRVLVVDDEPGMLENIERMLAAEGYRCETLQDPLRFRDVLAEYSPDVVITDLKMPGADGMTLLAAALADDPTLPVIVITAFATVDSAVTAIQEGAFDYLAKPFSSDELLVTVDRAARYRDLLIENRSLRSRVQDQGGMDGIVGTSGPVTRLVEQVVRVAETEANVLITGESGTGKELVAHAVHNHSARAGKPFMPVDCVSLPEGLLESELFGYEKGAFTGAVARRDGLLVAARGGTVFLDEVGDMPPSLQAKLLRALEQRQVRRLGDSRMTDLDIRIIAATNRDLQQAVREGHFREDLYYRLNVVHFEIPPLRARAGDVPLLVQHFLERYSTESGKEPPQVTADAWEALEAYSWPGNVRQLKNLVQRLVVLDSDGKISSSDLPGEVRFGKLPERGAGGHGQTLPYADAREEALLEFKRHYLDQVMAEHENNVSRAAETAGVSRRTLHRLLAEVRGEVPEEDAL